MTMTQGRGRNLAADYDVEGFLLAGERALLVEGNLRAGRRWFDAAYRGAEHRGDARAMGRAALGLGGLWAHEHRTAAEAAMVRVRQQDVLGRIDPRSTLALRLRIRLAGEEDYRTGGHTAILAMLEEARRAGDSVSLAEALSLAHHCVLGPEHGSLRLELAQGLIGEAARTSRRGDLLMGLLWETVDLFLGADPRAERSLGELRGLLSRADHLAVGYAVSAIEVMLAIRAGEFGQAEALAAACAERGAAVGDANAVGRHAGQLGTIRWYQGRVAELVPSLSELVNSSMLSVVDHSGLAALAVAAAAAGDRRSATGALARLCGRDLADLPRTVSWLMTMYCVAEAAHLLADTEIATRAHTLLVPFARLPAITGLGVACVGSVHHSLGVASLTTGDVDRAVRHLRLAVRDNLALGHWPAVALSRSRLGQALALRDGRRDEAARRELALAAQEAAGLGMKLPFDAAGDPAILVGETGNRAPVAECRRHGRYWRIKLGGRTALVDHSVGMRHLAVLLANPGVEIPAVDLAAGPALAGTAPAGDATGQPVLDELAKRKYKQRLSQLQAEIEELESASETERAAAVRSERDWLIAELASATGMGGRSRRFPTADERARIAVGKAIRRALDRITAADPAVGAGLRTAIHTGRRCCYRPQ